MPALDENVSVTVPLPRGVLDQVAELAERSHSTVEAQLGTLVEEGLKQRLTIRERLDMLSESYRARLAREGKLDMTAEEVMEELRQVREQVARDYYPE